MSGVHAVQDEATRDGVGISTEHGIRADCPSRFGVTGLALSPAGGRPNGSSRSCTRSAPERGVWREGKRRAQSHLYWGADRERNIFDADDGRGASRSGRSSSADSASTQRGCPATPERTGEHPAPLPSAPRVGSRNSLDDCIGRPKDDRLAAARGAVQPTAIVREDIIPAGDRRTSEPRGTAVEAVIDEHRPAIASSSSCGVILGRPFLEVRGDRQHDWLQRRDTGGMDCEVLQR